MSSEEGAELIAVGRVTRSHGVRGEVSVLPLSQVGSRFEPGSRLIVEGLGRTVTVVAARPHHHHLLIRFDEIPDRTEAEALHGRYLLVSAADVPDLPEGEYWPHQLVGSEVVTEQGRPLGRIREVVHTQANDVWVADGAEGVEVLIPALRDVVLEVDVGSSRVVVREVPGLTAP